jgi:hypothetical protein
MDEMKQKFRVRVADLLPTVVSLRFGKAKDPLLNKYTWSSGQLDVLALQVIQRLTEEIVERRCREILNRHGATRKGARSEK